MDILDMKLEANRVTRSYLMEVFKEIDNERTKASYLLAFGGLIVAQLFSWMENAPMWCRVGFVVFAVLSLGGALYNLCFAKPTPMHANYDGLFKAKEADSEKFLQQDYEKLREQKKGAEVVRDSAIYWNRFAILFLVLMLIFPALYFLRPTHYEYVRFHHRWWR